MTTLRLPFCLLALVAACGADTVPATVGSRRAAVVVTPAGPVYRDLRPHWALEPLPELTDPGVTLHVSPGQFANWDLVLAQPADTYALEPGDYTPMGVLTLDEKYVGTRKRRKVIRYVEANVPPWKRQGQALIAGFQVGDIQGNPSHHWILHGLTMRHGTWENSIRNGSSGIIVDQLLMQQWQNQYGIRILLYAHHNVIQRSIFDDQPVVVGGDPPAIQIRIPAPSPASLGGSSTMHGNRIVNNQIFDYVDSVAITHSVTNIPTNYGINNGTIIAGNDFQTTARRQLPTGYGSTENGLDIKAGSSDADDPVQIIDNRISGFRYTDITVAGSGSDGAGIVVHNWARNIYIARNTIVDVPLGIRVDVWPTGQPQVPRGVDIENCVFYGMGVFSNRDRGVALQSRLPVSIRGNVFYENMSVLDMTMVSGQHWMANNIAVSTGLGLASTPWASGVHNAVMSPSVADAAGIRPPFNTL